MRILLADDDPKVCSALKLLLEHQPGVAVLGATGSVEELLILAEVLQPDLVLLDWELAGLPGAETVSALRAALPSVRVLVLSSRPRAKYLASAAGANGFASKGDPPEVLLTALAAAGSAE